MYYNSSTNETNMVYGNIRQAFNDFVFLAQDNFQKREKNMAESDMVLPDSRKPKKRYTGVSVGSLFFIVFPAFILGITSLIHLR